MSNATEEDRAMALAPFNPDPECEWCDGKGFWCYGDGCVSRCECTNWSEYAELRREKGLTMQQAMDEKRAP